MKIVVLGKSGQVASCLGANSDPGVEIVALGRQELDLASDVSLRAPISGQRPDAIINAAAYTAVDKAEEQPEEADALNHLAVRRIGEAAQALGIPVVHISTDYVFNGEGTEPWAPSGETNPLGSYGASKLAGEQALARVSSRYAILRTSWVFSEFGGNFVKTMLRLGKERASLNVVADQIGGPTAASDIASATITIAKRLIEDHSLKGAWHYSGWENCSWADFATEIFRQARIDCAVNPIPTTDYPTPAQRPLNSRLDCSTTLRDFGVERPDWKHSLNRVLQELGEI